MKKTQTGLLVLVSMILAVATPSHAYVVDGFLGDWGVTPFTDWTPTNATVDYKVPQGGESGGEIYDVEAFYFDDDDTNIYFALVTSFPQSGVAFSGGTILPGDIALKIFGGNSQTIGSATFDYDFGITAGAGNEGKVYQNPTWTLAHGGSGIPANAPAQMLAGSGTFMGTGSLAYNTVFYGTENGEDTWVIEGQFAKSLFGGLLPGQNVDLHWTMTCGNDVIDLNADIDNPVPEPATMLLLGTGLLGVAGLRKRKAA